MGDDVTPLKQLIDRLQQHGADPIVRMWCLGQELEHAASTHRSQLRGIGPSLPGALKETGLDCARLANDPTHQLVRRTEFQQAMNASTSS